MITILSQHVTRNILVNTSKVKVTAWPFSKIVSGPQLCYLKSDFTIILHNWSSYWHGMSGATFGSLFKSQGHIMIFQHNCVRPITSLFKVLFKNCSHKWSLCWDDMSRTSFESLFEGQGHSMTFQHNHVQPITLWFEVEFYNYFTWMITILRQCVACNIWVAILKAKVTTWPCIKIVFGPKLFYLKSDFTTTFDKLLLCVQYLFGEHYPVLTGSCFIKVTY